MKTTEENLEIVADFMEMQQTKIGWYDSESLLELSYTTDNTFDDLLFNKSWEWLMSVVGLIDKIMLDEPAKSPLDIHAEEIFSTLRRNDITLTFNNVVKFIERYNEIYNS